MIYLLFTFSSAFRCCLSCGFLTFLFFFLNDPPTTEIYPLPLHAPLPISPGDPGERLLGPTATPAQLAAQRRALGLDRPLAAQYAIWLARFVRGDWGRSIATGRPVRDRKSTRLNSSHGYISYAVFCLKK